MKRESDALLRWLSGQLDHIARLNVIETIVAQAMPFPGNTITFTMDHKTHPFTFDLRLDVYDNSVADLFLEGLREKIIKTQPGAWSHGDKAESGIICNYGDKVVALISTGDVVNIEIDSYSFGVVLNSAASK